MEGTFEIEMFMFLMHLFRFQGEKENSLKTDDYGRDLSSVQTLLTKQVSANAASTLERGGERRCTLLQCKRLSSIYISIFI